ncbi:hypothetical protein GCM10027089_10240 [Nocardia thraciensis]
MRVRGTPTGPIDGSEQLPNDSGPQEHPRPRVDLLGRYSNPIQAAQLHRAIEVVESSSPRSPAKTDVAVPEPRALRRRLSAEIQAEIVVAYQDGVPTTELAVRYGIAKAGVLKLLRDRGVVMRRQPMTMSEVDLAVKLYQREKLSLLAISRRLSKPKTSVREALLARGVRLRDSHGGER